VFYREQRTGDEHRTLAIEISNRLQLSIQPAHGFELRQELLLGACMSRRTTNRRTYVIPLSVLPAGIDLGKAYSSVRVIHGQVSVERATHHGRVSGQCQACLRSSSAHHASPPGRSLFFFLRRSTRTNS
jgi:hypothetical protein